jgi:hypothetical protein
MAESRTLKLSILADVDQLKKSLASANGDVEHSSSRLGDFGKKAGLAFAVAGAAAAAYAGKLLIDGVKAAIEDEAAQSKLATTLKNVTGATNLQVAATEAYILKTSLATGKTDDELRPSLDRLIRSTKDVAEAQRLQALALDISAGSGKSLEAVSNALAKSAEGQNTALGKLGVGISAAELKTMTFTQITAALSTTFADQASIQADTFAGKMDRLKVAFDEGKETVGSFVLDAITPMVTTFVDDVVPVIQTLATEIGENLAPVFKNLQQFFTEFLIPIFKKWWEFLTEIVIPGIVGFVTPIIRKLFAAFSLISDALADNKAKLSPLFTLFKEVATFVSKYLAPVFGEVLGGALAAVGSLISGLIDGFANLVAGIMAVINAIKKMIDFIKNNPIVSGIGDMIGKAFGGGKAIGGNVVGGTSYLVGERGPELFIPQSSGSIVPNNSLGSGDSTVININVSGALDPISTARQIANLLGNAATSAGSFNTLGISRVVA